VSIFRWVREQNEVPLLGKNVRLIIAPACGVLQSTLLMLHRPRAAHPHAVRSLFCTAASLVKGDCVAIALITALHSAAQKGLRCCTLCAHASSQMGDGIKCDITLTCSGIHRACSSMLQ